LWKLRRYELYGAIGTTQFFGDIGGFTPGDNGAGFKDIIISQTRFSASTGLRYRIIENVAVKGGVSFGLIHASDAKGSNVNRDMEATTALFEPAITGEYYFLKNKAESSYRFSKGQPIFSSILANIDGYIYAGVAPIIYSVTPNEKLESVIQKESGVAASFPLGVGFNYLISPNMLVGIDVGVRYTTTDYLDGYSSQYSNSNDVYYFMTFVFTHKLKTSEKGLPSFRK
jgi:hypothetical protein